MTSTFHGQGILNDDSDGELALTFLTEFHLLEQALVRAGFTRAGRSQGTAQPDWTRFVRHIEARFRPDSSPELQGAVSYLLCDRRSLERRRAQLRGSFPGEASSAQSDIVWLSELVQETGNALTHGMRFGKTPAVEFEYLMAALLVVAAWSCCDPTVERLLMHTQ